jgi:hypothetical protein
MTAPRGYAHQTSTGRKTSAAAKVREVESLPCDGGGLHVLTNDGGVTLCRGCGVDWATLDAAVRA